MKAAGKGVGLLMILGLVVAAALTFGALQQRGGGPKTQTFDITMGAGEVMAVEASTVPVAPAKAIVGEYLRWEPGVLVVNKGDKVVLNVSNPRSGSHSLVLVDFGVDTYLLSARTGKKTVEFTADKAGVFKFTCGIPYDPRTAPRDCDPDHVRQTGYLVVLDK